MSKANTKPTPRCRRFRSGDLFSGGCQQLSPRLEWLKNHDVRTHEFVENPEKPRTYNHVSFGRWIAYVGKMPRSDDDPRCKGWACGNSEDEVIVNLARCMGWKLWPEELADTEPLNAKPLNAKL